MRGSRRDGKKCGHSPDYTARRNETVRDSRRNVSLFDFHGALAETSESTVHFFETQTFGCFCANFRQGRKLLYVIGSVFELLYSVGYKTGPFLKIVTPVYDYSER